MSPAMTPEEFLADLARIGLPVSEAPRLLGASRSAVYRYAAGQARIPEPVRRILKLEVERGERDVKSRAND